MHRLSSLSAAEEGVVHCLDQFVDGNLTLAAAIKLRAFVHPRETEGDVDSQVQELRSRGIQFLGDPRDFPDWTIRAAYLRDPDGNLIELYSPLEESKWTPRVAQQAEKYRKRDNASP